MRAGRRTPPKLVLHWVHEHDFTNVGDVLAYELLPRVAQPLNLARLELFVSSVKFERRHYHENVMSFVIKRCGGPDAPERASGCENFM